MNRKAQAAMEYLMTYGWAILIVIIVAAALYALGVFNPATWTGTRSTGFANIGQPTDWLYQANGEFNITVKNSLGQSMTVQSISAKCGVGGTNVTLSTTAASQVVGPGSSIEYYTDVNNCASLTTGSSYSVEVTISYTKGTGVYAQRDAGTVTGSVI